MARRQRRDLSVFESSCHPPTCLPHTLEASHCPFNCWTSSREAVNTNFYSLWFDPTGNRTRVYRFSSRRSIHSTTDRFNMVYWPTHVGPGLAILSFSLDFEFHRYLSNLCWKFHSSTTRFKIFIIYIFKSLKLAWLKTLHVLLFHLESIG